MNLDHNFKGISMSSPSAFNPSTSVSFVIKNNSSIKRSIKVFNFKLNPGGVVDLMKLAGVTEEDIRTEVLKGSLRPLLAGGSLQVVSSTVNFSTQSGTHGVFLASIGISGSDIVNTTALTQANWYIDPVSGVDSNDGAILSTPLKTFAEIVRRWGTNAPVLKQDTSITFVTGQNIDSNGNVLPAGRTATISAVAGGLATLTGLTGMVAAFVGLPIIIHGAANAGNNGTFVIAAFISATSVQITNPNAVFPDSYSGKIVWTMCVGAVADPIIIAPFVDFDQLTITTIPTVVSTGILTGVVTKNVLTPQLLQANIGIPPVIGMCVINTTAGKESRAWVRRAVAGNVAELTQPLTPVIVQPTNTANTAEQQIDTWANGDTFRLEIYPYVNIVSVQGFASLIKASQTFSPVMLYRLSILDPVVGGGPMFIGSNVSMQENFLQRGPSGLLGPQARLVHSNNHFSKGVFRVPAPGTSFVGGEIDEVCTLATDGLSNFDQGIIFNLINVINSSARSTYGDVYITGTTGGAALNCVGGYNNVMPTGVLQARGSGFRRIWGPGAIVLQGTTAGILYSAPASGSGTVASIIGTAPNVTLSGLTNIPGGSAASITAKVGSLVTITGLTGISPGMVNSLLTFSGAANAGNNGSFVIASWISATSVKITNANGVNPDANSGAISWTPLRQIQVFGAASAGNNNTYQVLAYVSATSVQVIGVSGTGAAASISQVDGPLATITGLVGIPIGIAPLNSPALGRTITITGAANPANNGTFLIRVFISATSVQIYNPNAVKDVSGALGWTINGNVSGDANNGVISWSVGAFLNAGGLFINQSQQVDAYNSVTGTYTPTLALTPAQLDTLQSGGGFANGPGGGDSSAAQPQTGCVISSVAPPFPANL